MKSSKTPGLDLFGNPEGSLSLNSSDDLDAPEYFLDLADTGETVETEQRPIPHFTGLGIFIILTVLVLGLQCFRLQVIQGSTNRSLAEGNSLRLLSIPAERGLIVDSNNAVLAQNSRQLALAINPQTLPAKRNDRLPVYALLQKKAGISDQTIALIEENRLKSPDLIAIKTNLSKDESLLYKEWFSNTPGVTLLEVPIRQYANMPSLGHLLGYVGSVTEDDVANGYSLNQQIGKLGVEKTYDKVLSGSAGKEKAEINAAGEIVPSSTIPLSPAQSGQTLKLSIDEKLQNIVATALANELTQRTKQYGALPDLGASAVVVDPSTGAVKAMVSLPDYNDQLFAQGIKQDQYNQFLQDPGNPLLNRAIQGQYPPGSTVKPALAAAGLQNGTIKPDTQMVTPDAIYVGTFRFPDWKVHGLTNTRKAIAESNDIFFYALGGGWPEKNIQGMGIDKENQYLANFGFGSTLGIDLPGEVSGLLGTPTWKEQTYKEPWYIGDTYHASIGQGYTLVTPLQSAMTTATIANGGTLWKPQLAWSTLDPNTNKETLLPHTVLRKDFISAANLQVVREGMRETVLSGSARPLNTLTVTSAGKTGTAEFGDKGLTHAWYTGFAPYENPQIAFSILIEGGGDSFYSALPVAEEILRNYFGDPLAPGQKLNSAPDSATEAALSAQFHGEH